MSVDSIRKLCDQLSSTNKLPTRNAASATLKGLAFDDANFEALREAEAIPAIVAGLRAGAASAIARLNCADAVWSLSADEANRVRLREAGAIPLLAQLLFAGPDSSGLRSATHSAALTICNLVDLETGMPHEVGVELCASGGIEALVGLLPDVTNANAKKPCETQHAACQALAALSVNPEVGEHIGRDGVEKLVALVQMGSARAQISRHAAAALARMARNQPNHQALVREAGGIEPLIDLIADSVDDKWAFTEGDMQAAQHGAGALWILAAEQESKDAINEHQDARRLLASLLTGKMGKKAEGNAAGALLMLGMPRAFPTWEAEAHVDPVSVVTVSMEEVGVV